jgi:hypothetical protein
MKGNGGGGVSSADVPVLTRLGSVITTGSATFGRHATLLTQAADRAAATCEQFSWISGLGSGSVALSALYEQLGHDVTATAAAFRRADGGNGDLGDIGEEPIDVVGGPARPGGKRRKTVVLPIPKRKGTPPPPLKPLPETLPDDPIQARIAAARSQVGYREGKGDNTVFGNWKGSPNAPWCASFVSWAFATAGQPLPAINGDNGFARVEHGRDYAQRKGQLSKTPKVGDIFLIVRADGTGHTGIVVAVLPGGRIRTIEGNTNNNGSRTGTTVLERERAITSRMTFWTVPPPKEKSTNDDKQKG